MTTPSIGRVVHYVSLGSASGEYPSVCRAAIITEVASTDDRRIGLVALNPTGMFFHALCDGGCEYFEPANEVSNGETRGGTWHWPERV
jgi:hypothetical protein